MNITITYTNPDDEEVEETLPAHHVVCEECEGTGFHLRGSLHGAAFSMNDFHQCFEEPEDQEEYFRHGGRYDQVCSQCKGKNVVLVVDEDACVSDKDKRVLQEYNDYMDTMAAIDADDRATQRSEQRFGA